MERADVFRLPDYGGAAEDVYVGLDAVEVLGGGGLDYLVLVFHNKLIAASPEGLAEYQLT